MTTDIDLPTGHAWLWCAFAAVCQMLAALIGLSVWTSMDFATDFENGTYTADAGLPAIVATVLCIVGIFCALAAVFRPRASAMACATGSLLLAVGCVTGLMNLPLVGHYG